MQNRLDNFRTAPRSTAYRPTANSVPQQPFSPPAVTNNPSPPNIQPATEPAQHAPAPAKRRRIFNKLIFALAIIVVIAFFSVGGFMLYQNRQPLKQKFASLWDNKTQSGAQVAGVATSNSSEDMFSNLSKLIDLPQEKYLMLELKDDKTWDKKGFLASAEVGDTFLYYSKAGLSIIYRPSTKKLVNYQSGTPIPSLDQQISAPNQQKSTTSKTSPQSISQPQSNSGNNLNTILQPAVSQ